MSLAHRRELADLAETLTTERQLLEHLLFKLVEARLMLAADEARFVPQAMKEVEAVVDRIRLSETHRTSAIRRLAQAIGEPEARLTLGFLTTWAPEPFSTMFQQHREHFLQLTTEIEQVTLENRRLASLAVQNLTDTLNALLGQPGLAVYTPRGVRREEPGRLVHRVDEVL